MKSTGRNRRIAFGILTAALALAALASRPAAQTAFDADFTARTMRVDYFHTGNATRERVALDRIVADGAWAGSRTQLIDPVNYGQYQFEVRDLESNRLLYSRAAAPYDFLVILVNERTYGGGGIYNDQTTVAAHSAFARYLFIHEFGHHFAALGDEYYTSDVAYETGAAEKPEPWEPNLTALHDAKQLKWRDLVSADTPLPTPWNKEEFEKLSRAQQEVRRKLRAEGAAEEKIEALFREEREQMTKLLASSAHAGKVGAFEGAGYEAQGLYRASTDCIMFTRDEVGFCKVCYRAINKMIDAYTR